MSLRCRVLPLLPPGEWPRDGPRLSWMPNKVSSPSEDLFLSLNRGQEANFWCPAASVNSHSLPFLFYFFFSFSRKKELDSFKCQNRTLLEPQHFWPRRW